MADPSLFDIGSGSTQIRDTSGDQATSVTDNSGDAGYTGAIPLNVYRVLWQEGARTPETIAALASELRNRHDQTGKDYTTLITDPNQYGPGSPKSSGEYKGWLKASQVPLARLQPIIAGAEDILTGKAAPTNNFTQHWSPSAAMAFGGSRPSWADDSGTSIGGNIFYSHPIAAGPDTGDPDLLTIGGGNTGTTADSKVKISPTAGTPNPGAPTDQQANTVRFLEKYGLRDVNAEAGSSQNPLAETATSGAPTKDGTWYIERGTGALRQVGSSQDFVPAYEAMVKRRAELQNEGPLNRLFSLGDFGAGDNPAGGAPQGAMDIAGSTNKLLGGGLGVPGDPLAVALGQTRGAPSAYDYAKASQEGYRTERNNYDALRHGDALAATGRFLGQTAALAPLMATGEGTVGAAAGVAERAAPWLSPGLRFLGGSAGQGGDNLLLQMASRGAQGAPQGAAAAALTSGTSDQPLVTQLEHGAGLGGVFGGIAPIAGAGKSARFGGSAPLPSDIADLASLATDKYGLPLTRLQILGATDRSAKTQWSNLLSSNPFFAKNYGEQNGLFTRRVSNTFGEDTDRLTSQVMQRAKDRIGATFDRVAANTTIGDTNRLQSDLGAIISDAQQVVPDSEISPLVKQVENIGSTIQNGQMTGESYQALTRKGGALDRLQNSDNPNLRYYGSQIRGALDDALARSAGAEDLADLQNARWQYKNLMTIAPLAAKAPLGEIAPQLLAGQVNRSFKNRAFSGAGDLGELSDIAKVFMSEPPNSYTPARFMDILKNNRLLLGGGAGLAGGANMLLHNPELAGELALGTGAALGAKAIGSRVTNFTQGPWGASRLLAGGRERQLPPSLQAFIDDGNSLLAPAYIPAGVAGTNMLLNPVESPVR